MKSVITVLHVRQILKIFAILCFLGDLQSFELIGVSLGFSFRLMRKPKKAEIWEIFAIIIFCEKDDFYVSAYYSPHSDNEIMIDTSFDSA